MTERLALLTIAALMWAWTAEAQLPPPELPPTPELPPATGLPSQPQEPPSECGSFQPMPRLDQPQPPSAHGGLRANSQPSQNCSDCLPPPELPPSTPGGGTLGPPPELPPDRPPCATNGNALPNAPAPR